jgi:hypothetical protein
MIEFSPSESSPLPEAGAAEYGISVDKVEAGNSDWLFRLLILLALLTFLLALTAGLLQFLSWIFPAVGWLQSVTYTMNNSILPAALLPEDMPGGFFITLILLALSGLFFIAARWRILHNPAMQAAAGCPSCQEIALVRVHRTKKDRLISALGIPFARYQCRECPWNGLRIRQVEKPASYAKDNLAMPVATQAIDEPAGVGEPDVSAQDFDNFVVPAENENSAAVTPLTLEHYLPNASGSIGSSSEMISQEGSSQAEPIIEYQEPVRGQEGTNDQDYAKIVSPLGLNLRKDPQPDGKVIGRLEPGTMVKLLEQSKQVGGITWREIRDNDQVGWVVDSFLEW